MHDVSSVISGYLAGSMTVSTYSGLGQKNAPRKLSSDTPLMHVGRTKSKYSSSKNLN